VNRDLTVGQPQKVLWQFCLPLFGSVVFQQLYNLADSWVAGRFIGENALAAVGNSYEITLIYLAFAFGCNIGCSVVSARYFGAHDYVRVKSTVSTAFIASAVLCTALLAAGLGLDSRLLKLINTPEVLMEDSKLYFDIYTLGLPFVFFYNSSTGVFSAFGDSATPFYFLAASSLSNIAMDILFVGPLDMGVAGLAWATLICQGISCLLSLAILLRRLRRLAPGERGKLFDPQIFKSFSLIALPSIAQQGFISVGNIIIQSIINGFGPGVIAGYAAGVKLNNLVITSFTTIGNGISNFTSQNLGAKKHDRIRAGFKSGIGLIWSLSLPFALLYFCFAPALIRFFISNPGEDAIRSGVIFLRILSPFFFVVSAKLVSDGVLRGAGLMKAFMVGTFTDLILRVVLAWAFSKTALGYVGIWCAWPVGWSVATVLSIIFYRRSDFARIG